ncbi:MAG: imelysin family protein, partial [Pseudomonadota bacterium]
MKSAIIIAASALSVTAAVADTSSDVIKTYSDIALAAYEDSLLTAQALDAAIDNLIANPSEATMLAARSAWLAARVPYQQTEVYRFGNAIVDDWEGKVNAWPLDEGLIDYVSAMGTAPTEGYDDNPAAGLNVIANASFTLSGEEIDAS